MEITQIKSLEIIQDTNLRMLAQAAISQGLIPIDLKIGEGQKIFFQIPLDRQGSHAYVEIYTPYKWDIFKFLELFKWSWYNAWSTYIWHVNLCECLHQDIFHSRKGMILSLACGMPFEFLAYPLAHYTVNSGKTKRSLEKKIFVGVDIEDYYRERFQVICNKLSGIFPECEFPSTQFRLIEADARQKIPEIMEIKQLYSNGYRPELIFLRNPDLFAKPEIFLPILYEALRLAIKHRCPLIITGMEHDFLKILDTSMEICLEDPTDCKTFTTIYEPTHRGIIYGYSHDPYTTVISDRYIVIIDFSRMRTPPKFKSREYLTKLINATRDYAIHGQLLRVKR